MRTAQEIQFEQDNKFSFDVEALVSQLTTECYESAMNSATRQHINVLKLLDPNVYEYAIAYMAGKPSPFSHVIKELQKLGYGIQIQNGGHASSGAINVTWVPLLNNFRYN